MSESARQSTGIPALDDMLGGGLLPGTLTVAAGATGIGKTQLGVQYCQAGLAQEGHRGVVFDVCARGDSQSHAEYARRMFSWELSPLDAGQPPHLDNFFFSPHQDDYLHVFDYHGRRVTRRDLEFDEWRDWQAELNARLRTAIAFVYGALVRGVRRVVVDGVEPVDRPSDSIQLHLFEYVYHQILKKEAEWVARDLFREQYRAHAAEVATHLYSPASVGGLLLYTTHETMLEDLISRPLDEGDVLANANTLLYFGKIRDGSKIGRALYIAKHRGSRCSEEIVPYRIDDGGIQIDS